MWMDPFYWEYFGSLIHFISYLRWIFACTRKKCCGLLIRSYTVTLFGVSSIFWGPVQVHHAWYQLTFVLVLYLILGKKYVGVEFSASEKRGKCFVFIVLSLLTFAPVFYFLYLGTQNESYSTYHLISTRTAILGMETSVLITILSAIVDAFAVFDVLFLFLVHASIAYACILSVQFWIHKVRYVT